MQIHELPLLSSDKFTLVVLPTVCTVNHRKTLDVEHEDRFRLPITLHILLTGFNKVSKQQTQVYSAA
jgi:hypothetical protein